MKSTSNFDAAPIGNAYIWKRGENPIADRRNAINTVVMSAARAITRRYHRCLPRLECILAAIALAFISTAWAVSDPAPVILSQDGDYRETLAQHSRMLLDHSRAMTIDGLLGAPGKMAPVTKRYVDFGLTDARIWLRTSLTNPSQKSDVWRLDLRRQFVRALDVYVVRNGVVEKVLSHTGRDAFSERAIPSRYLAVDIPVSGQETVDIIIVYESDAATWLPYLISTKEAYAVAHARENSVNWLLNGALGTVLIIALILSPVVRWQTSVAFAPISSPAAYSSSVRKDMLSIFVAECARIKRSGRSHIHFDDGGGGPRVWAGVF